MCLRGGLAVPRTKAACRPALSWFVRLSAEPHADRCRAWPCIVSCTKSSGVICSRRILHGLNSGGVILFRRPLASSCADPCCFHHTLLVCMCVGRPHNGSNHRHRFWVLTRDFLCVFSSRQVMCAVMHLHDSGVIHKDIKVR